MSDTQRYYLCLRKLPQPITTNTHTHARTYATRNINLCFSFFSVLQYLRFKGEKKMNTQHNKTMKWTFISFTLDLACIFPEWIFPGLSGCVRIYSSLKRKRTYVFPRINSDKVIAHAILHHSDSTASSYVLIVIIIRTAENAENAENLFHFICTHFVLRTLEFFS